MLPCLVAPRCFLVAPRSCSLRSVALAVLHYLGWKPSNPQVWNDATLDVFENRGILPVSDWTGEGCFVGIRESFVSQLFVQGSSWGQQLENKSEEERDAVWKKILTQCGANLTSPGLSVHSGALVRVLVFVHHMLLFRLVDVGLLGKARHLITLADGRSDVHFEVHKLVFVLFSA